MQSSPTRWVRWLFSFDGRLSRGGFWGLGLPVLGAFVVLFVFLESAIGRGATWLLYPLLAWILAALMVRRLHDRARSPWWLFVALVPVFGPLWLFFEMALRRGTPGDNQYGDDPRLVRADYLTVA